jgi:uncharacterized protein (DUF1800 family)/uncharacterized protein (DUF1501 family)
MDAALRALNRFGMGARVGERARISDPKGWLLSQLQPSHLKLRYENRLPSDRKMASAINRFRDAARMKNKESRKQARRELIQMAKAEADVVFRQRIVSEAPFVERLVAFWSNHLCISLGGKPLVIPFAGKYEREAIRPHVLGRFSDMVLASAKHPAMLIYLDNVRSMGPSSRVSRRAARRGKMRGLNENYAHELLELHTLGVDGGYTQKDVEQLALILTGWSIRGIRPRERDGRFPEFMFRAPLHEPGTKTVMGIQYREAGMAEGERAIQNLTRHVSTARFIAKKLVQHFVSDDPPPKAVDRIAHTFFGTGGDLIEVSKALVDLKEAWEPDHLKFRTPQDWIVAVFRALDVSDVPPRLFGVLRKLRHPLWGAFRTERIWGHDARMGRPRQFDEPGRTCPDDFEKGGKAPNRTGYTSGHHGCAQVRSPLWLASRQFHSGGRAPGARHRRPRLSVEMSMDRRTFIRGMCLGGFATFALPTVNFAKVPGRGKLVFVLLRGGFDGLASVVPYGDPGYRSTRGRMAFERSDVTPLQNGFGLAPGLTPLKGLWTQGELVAVHAMAIPFRTRSHFDGQAVLETGLDRPRGASDGWLNRLLQIMEGKRSGIAVAAGLPRSMSGKHPVLTWSPTKLGALDDGYIERLHVLYQRDPKLLNRFEAALQMKEMDTGSMGPRRSRVVPLMQATARFIKNPDGPNVAAMEFSGWDTHVNQGLKGGALDRRLGQLAKGILAFKKEAGPAWADTTMVVMTEFGRTVRINGSRGTDHGTAGLGLVLGPNLARSAVISDWPGLSERNLFERRDLRPTLDTRALLKGVAAGVFDLNLAQTNRIFPDSDKVKGLSHIMR